MKILARKSVAIFLVMCIGLFMTNNVDAAAKPGKVKKLKATSTNITVTLTWGKAKKAKKYEVWQFKSKKYKKVKTVKTKKVVIKNLRPSTNYKFKVRAINGKKKGNFSAVKKVKTKKAIVHKEVITMPTKVKFKQGHKYTIKSGDDYITFTVDLVNKYKDEEADYYTCEGKTDSGASMYYSRDIDRGEGIYYRDKDFFKYADIESESSYIDGVADVFILKDNSIEGCWALDGTIPKLGQEDLFGYSKYCVCLLTEDLKDNKEFYDTYNGISAELDEFNYNPVNAQVWTKLRGALKKGKNVVWKEPHTVGHRCAEGYTVKMYRNSKLFYEQSNINEALYK